MWACRLTTWAPPEDFDYDRVQEHHRPDGVQRAGLPGLDLLKHRVGDVRDRLMGELGAQGAVQVGLDVTHGHPAGIQVR